MKLYAISDLHVNHPLNWQALAALPPHPHDWLIVAGDISEKTKQFRRAMGLLANRFGRVFWTPGNHDLWTLPTDVNGARGLALYHQLVGICRELGVVTPEDPFVRWPNDESHIIALTFTLYDYSFRPDTIAPETAVAWAEETGVVCTDEILLHSDPFPSRAAWCASRVRQTEERLAAAAQHGSLVLVNHRFGQFAPDPPLFSLVRQQAHRSVAYSFFGNGRCLRPFTHPWYSLPGWCSL